VLVVDRATAASAALGLAVACLLAGQVAARVGGRFQLVRQLRDLA
jgi:hypothetical protein